MKILHACAFAIGGLLAFTGAAFGQSATQRIRGDVAAMNGHSLDVKTGAGRVVTVRLADNARVIAQSAADPGAIKPGAFIATTAIVQPDGTLSAVEVRIFPESMRGVGEGHRPMDAARGSTMTNATVTSVTPGKAPARNTMTNATVSDVSASGAARRITVKYKDGEKVVVVGDGIPVTTLDAGDTSMLVPGAHVVVSASKLVDGTLASDRITVGKDGFVPPN